jgi:Ni/Co efflux regulator RcnB
MKNKVVISAVAAASIMLTAGEPAFAQDHGKREDRGHAVRAEHARPPARAHVEVRHEGRGAGPGHSFYKGERLPVEYRHRNYVVDDWRGHHLSAPPRGYHWVQTGGDYVLVAIATGIIAQLLLGN